MSDLKQAITRLIEAAHRGSELLDGCPDDDVAAAASTELSAAAAAVGLLLSGEATVPCLVCGRPLSVDRIGDPDFECFGPKIEKMERRRRDRNPVNQADEE